MFLISIGTFACILASLCGSQWVTLTTQGMGGKRIAAFNNGLWKECVDDGGPDLLCMDIEGDKKELTSKSTIWLKYVRGFGIAACVTASLTIILTAVGYWKNKVIYASTVIALFTGIKMVAALVVFQRNNHWTDEYNFQYGSSFDLGISGACLSGLTFINGLFSILYSEDKDSKPNRFCRRQDDDRNNEVCVQLNTVSIGKAVNV